jgi:hypothetical protein
MKTEEEILALNDPGESFFYCKHNQQTANIKAHQEIVIKSLDFHCCYKFATDIVYSDKQLLSEVILLSCDEFFIKNFYENVNFDKTRYETLLLFI